MVEDLESRKFLSAVIQISTTGNAIVIKGDAESNTLSINEDMGTDGTPSGGVLIRTNGTLIIDGQVNEGFGDFQRAIVFTQKPWRIDTGPGDDSFVLTRYEDSIISITAKLGDGNDDLYVDSHFYPKNIGSLAVDGGLGDDRIALGNIGGNVSIFPGYGQDRISFKADRFAAQDPRLRIAIQGKLQIVDTQGKTSLDMSYVDVRKETFISTGNSIDHLMFSGVSFRRAVTLIPRNGSDVITSIGSRFRQGLSVFGGTRDDFFTGFENVSVVS